MIRLKLAGAEYVHIDVSGRINSANAEAVYNDISQIRSEHTGGRLILDCPELEYISSAGLRILLKLQKSENNRILLKQVTPGVEEVLTQTGFTRILDVENDRDRKTLPGVTTVEKICARYIDDFSRIPPEELAEIENMIREISTDRLEVIARGSTGSICRLDSENLIKIYNRGTPLTKVFRELMLSKRALINGLPTAISYAVVRTDGCYGTVFEMIDGETLASAINREPGNYEYYASEYAELLRTIHGTHVKNGILPSAKKIYLNASDRCTAYYTPGETAILKQLISAIPDRNTLVHRDYHPKNIMVSEGKLILIDMADISTGHPVFDWMGIMTTHQFFAEKFPEAVKNNCGVSAETCIKLKDSLFGIYFKDRNPAETEAIKKQLNLISGLHIAVSPALREEQPDEINRILVQEAKTRLFPYTEKLTDGINW